jgi:hypothetical protein
MMLVIMPFRRVLPFCKMMAGAAKRCCRYCGAKSIEPLLLPCCCLDHQPPLRFSCWKISCWEGIYQLAVSHTPRCNIKRWTTEMPKCDRMQPGMTTLYAPIVPGCWMIAARRTNPSSPAIRAPYALLLPPHGSRDRHC